MKNRTQANICLYRTDVAVLGCKAAGSVTGVIALAMAGHSIPEVIVALGSVAIGSLTGLLTPSPLIR
jgi:hypothetical protein